MEDPEVQAPGARPEHGHSGAAQEYGHLQVLEGDGENAFEDTGEGIDFDNLVSPASFPLLLPSSLLLYCSFPSSSCSSSAFHSRLVRPTSCPSPLTFIRAMWSVGGIIVCVLRIDF